MIGRSGERGSGISVLAARHDDDDDDIYIYIYILREKVGDWNLLPVFSQKDLLRNSGNKLLLIIHLSKPALHLYWKQYILYCYSVLFLSFSTAVFFSLMNQFLFSLYKYIYIYIYWYIYCCCCSPRLVTIQMLHTYIYWIHTDAMITDAW